MVVAIGKSEESAILSWEFGSYHVHLDSDFHAWSDRSIHDLGGGLKVISVCLDENDIFRPFSLSAVSEGPFFDESLHWLHQILVTKVLFDESCHVDDFLFIRFSSRSDLFSASYLRRCDLRLCHLALIEINIVILVAK